MKFDLSFLLQHEPTKDSPSSLKAPKQPSHLQSPSTAMTGATLLQVATTARTTKTSPSPPAQTSSVPLPSSSMEITSSASSPQQHPQLGSSVRSASIPLPSSHIDRTQSELQLCVDEAAAEQRELTMFYRVVNGIRERQQTMAAAHPYPPPPQSRPTPASHSVPPYHPTNHKNPRSFHGANGVDETESSYHTAVPLHAVEDTHSPPEDDAMDSWSITGYSEHDGAAPTTMIPPFEEQQSTSDPSDPNEEEDAVEMGIFALDL